MKILFFIILTASLSGIFLISSCNYPPAAWSSGNNVGSATGITAVPAAQFLNSMGLQGHIEQGQDPSSVTADMVYLGVNNYRGGGDTNILVQMHKQFGIMFQSGTGGPDNQTLEIQLNVSRTLANVGALIADEGPNEPGNWYVTWNNVTSGQSDWTPVAEFEEAMYAACKSDPVLKNYPVWNASSIGDEANNVGLQYAIVPAEAVSNSLNPTGVIPQFIGMTNFDYANQHSYINELGHANYSNVNEAWSNFATNSILPYCDTFFDDEGLTWNKEFTGYNDVTPVGGLTFANMPRVNTETGWPTIPNNQEFPNNITQDQQGKLYMNIYLSAFKWGCSYTFIYEIIDDSENNWGFFDKNYNPKLSAIYTHDLTTILKDSNIITSPGKLNYSVTSGTSPDEPFTVHDLLLEKSNGDFEICVWDENPAGEDTVTLNLGAFYDNVGYFDPTLGTNAAPIGNVNSLTLQLSDHVVIVQIPNI